MKDGWPPGTDLSPLRLAVALDLEKIEYEPEVFPWLVTGTRSLITAMPAADELRHPVEQAGGGIRT